jgi:hypothetical protein
MVLGGGKGLRDSVLWFLCLQVDDSFALEDCCRAVRHDFLYHIRLEVPKRSALFTFISNSVLVGSHFLMFDGS